ncbi:hypothetical protein Egran_03206 [Elaphomyces granulatus]|uniref:Thioesterase domain-containing protein n=1 Tax=Elaphomyces granulatus TaxID=519963 RepID=A0A232LXY7_9EURO|nr:hypothetical protein Egran_03206 [Elaphomyces granulatus]
MTALRFVRSLLLTLLLGLGVLPGYFGFGTALQVTAAKPGVVNFELDIKKEHTNRLGIIHGGTLASMVDLGGSLAVASRGLFATGVSTDLNVTYLSSGGKIGDRIMAVCCKFLRINSSDLTATSGRVSAHVSIGSYLRQKISSIVANRKLCRYVALAYKDPQNIVDELCPQNGT